MRRLRLIPTFLASALFLLTAATLVFAEDAQPAASKASKPHPPASLAIGKVAPEIEGEDVDGKRFKLSDYRGKVVVLDFWGDW
jgi:cytochrome oxidase Cu insertion factor (SCO1/SenC/PrrC family)